MNGIKFDTQLADGTLIDAKGYRYEYFLLRQDSFLGQQVARDLVAQARRQLAAVEAAPVQWHVAEAGAADLMRELLLDAGITKITIIHVPMAGAP